jgi:hypothetical protein
MVEYLQFRKENETATKALIQMLCLAGSALRARLSSRSAKRKTKRNKSIAPNALSGWQCLTRADEYLQFQKENETATKAILQMICLAGSAPHTHN